MQKITFCFDTTISRCTNIFAAKSKLKGWWKIIHVGNRFPRLERIANPPPCTLHHYHCNPQDWQTRSKNVRFQMKKATFLMFGRCHFSRKCAPTPTVRPAGRKRNQARPNTNAHTHQNMDRDLCVPSKHSMCTRVCKSSAHHTRRPKQWFIFATG